jgi:amidohydrolase
MEKSLLDGLISEYREQVIEWRRYLHRYPEVSFQEYNTSQFVYDTLLSFGALEVSRPTPTSVVATLFGKYPGPVLAIRADMDALPIAEESVLEFRSENPGVMHACGHDGHTAILLGTAKILSSFQQEWNGEIRFIFQHGEERPPGGALELVEAGVLTGVDMIIGAHLWSPLETGKIGLLTGPTMAGGDLFNLVINGSGGHAGMPHQTIDPVPVGAQVITNLQQMISRECDPLSSLVLSVTKMNAGATHNAIADTAELGGTVRYFDVTQREKIPLLMERIIKGVTGAHGARYEWEYLHGYLPVINDPLITKRMEATVIKHLPEIVIQDMRPPMVGEDFSSYLTKTPGCFVLIGAGNEKKGIVFPHHHPRFTIDEDALIIGTKLFVHFVNDLLAPSS